MTDNFTELYNVAKKKGVLADGLTEQMFRDQTSTDEGLKSFYDYAVDNGMKLRPFNEFRAKAKGLNDVQVDAVSGANPQIEVPKQETLQTPQPQAQIQIGGGSLLEKKNQPNATIGISVNSPSPIDKIKEQEIQVQKENNALLPGEAEARSSMTWTEQAIANQAIKPRIELAEDYTPVFTNTPKTQQELELATRKAELDNKYKTGNYKSQEDLVNTVYDLALEKDNDIKKQYQNALNNKSKLENEFKSKSQELFNSLQQDVNSGKISVDDANAIYQQELTSMQNDYQEQIDKSINDVKANIDTKYKDYFVGQTRKMAQQSLDKTLPNAMNDLMYKMNHMEEVSNAPMKDFPRYRIAYELLEDAKKLNDAGKNGDTNGFFKDLGIGFGHGASDMDTWTFGITELGKNVHLKEVIDKWEKDPQSLSSSEKAILDAATQYMASAAYNSPVLSRGYKAGTTTAASIPFILQFIAANPALIQGKVVEGLLGYGLEQLGKNGAGALLKETGAHLLGTLAGAGAMTAGFGIPTIAAGTIEKITTPLGADFKKGTTDFEPTFFKDQQGNIVRGQSFGNALLNSTAEQFAANLSEMILTNAPLKEFFNAKLFGTIAGNPIGNTIAQVLNNPQWKAFATRAQWGGTPEEFIEEDINNILDWGMRTDKHDPNKSFLENASLTLDDQIDIFLGVAPMTVIMGGGSLAVGAINTIKDNKAINLTIDAINTKNFSDLYDKFANAENSGVMQSFAHDLIKQVNMSDKLDNNQKADFMRAIQNTLQATIANEVQQVAPAAAAQQAEQEIQTQTNLDDNQIYPVFINGNQDDQAFIVGGNVAYNEDGTIDLTSSDQAVFIRKMSDNKVYNVRTATLTAMSTPVDATQVGADVAEHAAAVEAVKQNLNVGDEIQLQNQLQNVTAEKATVEAIDEDGNVTITTDEGPQVIPVEVAVTLFQPAAPVETETTTQDQHDIVEFSNGDKKLFAYQNEDGTWQITDEQGNAQTNIPPMTDEDMASQGLVNQSERVFEITPEEDTTPEYLTRSRELYAKGVENLTDEELQEINNLVNEFPEHYEIMDEVVAGDEEGKVKALALSHELTRIQNAVEKETGRRSKPTATIESITPEVEKMMDNVKSDEIPTHIFKYIQDQLGVDEKEAHNVFNQIHKGWFDKRWEFDKNGMAHRREPMKVAGIPIEDARVEELKQQMAEAGIQKTEKKSKLREQKIQDAQAKADAELETLKALLQQAKDNNIKLGISGIEQQREDAELTRQVIASGARLVSAYVEQGYYKFADICDKVFSALGDLATLIKNNTIKKMYLNAKVDASDEVYNLMDSEDDVRKFDVENYQPITTTKKQSEIDKYIADGYKFSFTYEGDSAKRKTYIAEKDNSYFVITKADFDYAKEHGGKMVSDAEAKDIEDYAELRRLENWWVREYAPIGSGRELDKTISAIEASDNETSKRNLPQLKRLQELRGQRKDFMNRLAERDYDVQEQSKGSLSSAPKFKVGDIVYYPYNNGLARLGIKSINSDGTYNIGGDINYIGYSQMNVSEDKLMTHNDTEKLAAYFRNQFAKGWEKFKTDRKSLETLLSMVEKEVDKFTKTIKENNGGTDVDLIEAIRYNAQREVLMDMIDNLSSPKSANSTLQNENKSQKVLPSEEKSVSLQSNSTKGAKLKEPELDKNDYRTYMTDDAKAYFTEQNKDVAHPELAYISEASKAGVIFPLEVLQNIPEIVEAQSIVDSQEESLELSKDELNKYVEIMLDDKHGSAELGKDGKIIKVDGKEQFGGEVAREKKAYLIIGRPAGGKSSVFANPISGKNKARLIDADVAKEMLPGFNDGYGAGYVHLASNAIAEETFQRAIQRGENIVFPKIGGKSILRIALDLKSKGYRVELLFNDVSAESSYMRAMARFAEKGRYVDLKVLIGIGTKPNDTYSKYHNITIGELKNEEPKLFSGLEQNEQVAETTDRGTRRTLSDTDYLFDYTEQKNNNVGIGENPKEISNSKNERATNPIDLQSEISKQTFIANAKDLFVHAALVTKEKPFGSIIDIRNAAKQAGIVVDNENRDDIKLQEYVEDAIVRAARSIVEKLRREGANQRTIYDAIISLYEIQPTISRRSAERLAKQQYSTPIPMSFLADMFVYRDDMQRGLEPTAGNGMLVFGIPSNKIDVNEIDQNRLNTLKGGNYASVTEQDATIPFNRGKAYDFVITNPPFGSFANTKHGNYIIPGLEQNIAINALDQMKDDGRAAIIVGGNMDYAPNGGVSSDKSFYGYLYDNYNVVGVVDMSGGLYEKQGTSYPTRMILINGRRTPEEIAKERIYPPVQSKALPKATTFGELYDIIDKLNNSNSKTNGHAVLRTGASEMPISSQPQGTTNEGGRNIQPNQSNGNIQRERSGLDSGNKGELATTTGNDNANKTNTSNKRGSDAELGGDINGRNRGERTTGEQPAANSGSRTGVVYNNGNAGGVLNNGRTGSTTLREPVRVERKLDQSKLPYVTHNNAFSLKSVAPAAMVEAMDENMKRIEAKVGDIDTFVTNQLGYASIDEMHKALAAEQVDSVAMAIYQMSKGDGMIIGDQTGVGKGRQMAALIRWAVRNGKRPIFVTQKADLFSDIYRDLFDIGSGDLKPFIFNSDGAMTDNDGKVVYSPVRGEAQKKIFESGELPAEYDYVVLTYSQIQTGDELSRTPKKEPGQMAYGRVVKEKKPRKEGFDIKAKFFRQLAKDNYVMFDESHTAAGDGQGSAFLRSVMPDIKGVTFASATFAKRPDTMPLYAIKTAMGKANVEMPDLIEIIQKGGVTLQEIMSRALSSAGQMVRRERDMSDVVTDWETISDPDVVEASKREYDNAIKAFGAIIDFQTKYIDPFIQGVRDDLATTMGDAVKKKGTDKLGINNTPFASKIYNYTKQLMLALKSSAIVDKVENEIKAGRHPVIALENTMEASLKEYPIGGTINEPTFAASLLRGLDSTLSYTKKNDDGSETHWNITPAELGREGEMAYYDLRDFIKESTKNIFISPLDAIIDGLRQRGYKVGELTGRKTVAVKNSDGTVTINTRSDRDKKRLAREFNNGQLDVLILNKSASTGISLHASKTFKDQRQRTMIIAQPLSDINDYMQMIGRIDRTGQVARGYYIVLGLPVPAESRLMMMLSTKLKSLNANTTTSQENEDTDVKAPDLLNKYGSQAVVDYLVDNPDLYTKLSELGLKIGDGEKKGMAIEELAEYKPSDDSAIRKTTGYVALLSTKEQEKFYSDIVDRYNSLMQYLNDTGSNDLKITTMPLRAKLISRKVSSEGKEPDGNNPFAQNAYLETVEVDVLRKPMKSDEIQKGISTLKYGGNTGVKVLTEQLIKDTDNKLKEEEKRYAESLERVKREKEQAIKTTNAKVKLSQEEKTEEINKKIENIDSKVEEMHQVHLNKIRFSSREFRYQVSRFNTNRTYLIPDNLNSNTFSTSSPAIFMGYKGKDEKLTPSTTMAVFAVMDSRRKLEIKMTDIEALNSIINHTDQNYNAAQSVNIDNWDSQVPTENRRTAYILTGNILQAFSDSRNEDGGLTGQLISYTDIDGGIHDGILMPDNWNPMLLRNNGVPINARLADAINGSDLIAIDGSVKIAAITNPDGTYKYKLYVPSTKSAGSKYFDNESLVQLTNNGFDAQVGDKFTADVSRYNLEYVVRLLANMGVRVYDKTENQIADEIEITPEGIAYTEIFAEHLRNRGVAVELVDAEEADNMPVDSAEYQIVTNKEELSELDNDPKGYVEAYCTMAKIDGKYYSPMATLEKDEAGKNKLTQPIESGKWYKSDERTLEDPLVREKADGTGWEYHLIKPDGTDMWVAYDPYWHSTTSPLNDQFTSAWRRPELVTVKVLIPRSDIESGYKADGALLSTGEHDWNSGPVSASLKASGKGRKVILSQYRKIVGEVSAKEEAQNIANYLEGTFSAIPINAVRPQVRDELIKLGVKFTDINGNAGKGTQELNDILSKLGTQYVKTNKKNKTIEFQNGNGVVYGWYKNGKIYLVKGRLSPNTAVHEASHMLSAIMRQINPGGWADIVRLCKEAKDLWNEVVNDPNYNLTTDNEIASEVISRYSGKRGAEKLTQAMNDAIKQNDSIANVARARVIYNKVREALNKFWGWVTDLFNTTSFKNLDEVADMYLYELFDTTQLPTPPRGGRTEEQRISYPAPEVGESFTDYATRITSMRDSMRTEEAVNAYMQEIAKLRGDKAFGQETGARAAYSRWVDAASAIENFQKYFKGDGNVTSEQDAYNDTFLSQGRISFNQEIYERKFIRPMRNAVKAIMDSGKLNELDVKWQNLTDEEIKKDKERKNGKQLTPRELIGIYCQAKDIQECIDLENMPDRGAEGFVFLLGKSHEEIIDMVENVVPKEMIDNLWDSIRKATSYALDYMVDNGYILPEERAKYKRQYYVPERGWTERDFAAIENNYLQFGKYYNQPYNKALRQARGRKSLASDPFGYIWSIANSTINSVEKNKTKVKLLEYCLDREQEGAESGAFRVAKFWVLRNLDAEGNPIMVDKTDPITGENVQVPSTSISYAQPTQEMYDHDQELRDEIDKKVRKQNKLIRERSNWQKVYNDETIDDVIRNIATDKIESLSNKIDDLEKEIAELNSKIQILTTREYDGLPMRTNDEDKQHRVYAIKDGQQYELWFKDERVAQAINKDYDKWTAANNAITKAARQATRVLSAALTQYNPEFAASNFVRDYQVSLTSIAAEKGADWQKEFVKQFNTPQLQSAVWSYAINDKILNETKFTDSKYGKYLEEYFSHGAQTGFSFLKNLDVMQQDFNEMINEGNAKKVAKATLGTLSTLTEVSETTIRFAGYVTAREKGMSEDEAAIFAKELTTNFDRGGELSKSSVMALWSFFRATINGNLKFIKGFKNFAKGYSIAAAVYFVMGVLNALCNPDDPKDEIYFSNYVRESNFVLGKIFGLTAKVPVAHFLRMFFAMGNNVAQCGLGRKSGEQAMYDTVLFCGDELLPNWLNVTNFIEYDPRSNNASLNGKQYVQTAMPTPIAPIVDNALNIDFTGRAIDGTHGESWNKTKKPILTYRDDAPELLVRICQGIYQGLGGDLNVNNINDDNALQKLFDNSPSKVQHFIEGYRPPFLDLMAATGTLIYNAANEDASISIDDVPFIRKFYSEYKPDKVYRNEHWLLNSRVDSYEQLLKDTREGNRAKYNEMTKSDEYKVYQKAQRELNRQGKKAKSTPENIKNLMDLNIEWNKAY